MRIALTGGIGSGKSYVCRLLEQRGISIYDCDAAAKRLMRTSTALQQKLQALVGKDIYIDGQLNKAKMTHFLMASEENAKAINDTIHPAVADDFLKSDYQWMECAILFESGFDRLVDRTICVTAPEEVRIQRIMMRDGISRWKALEWMRKQWPQVDVILRSDYCIINDGVEDLEEQIDRILYLINS